MAVLGLSDAVEIAAGKFHSCARHATGVVVCWGSNYNGRLGDGTEPDGLLQPQYRTEPVRVRDLPEPW